MNWNHKLLALSAATLMVGSVGYAAIAFAAAETDRTVNQPSAALSLAPTVAPATPTQRPTLATEQSAEPLQVAQAAPDGEQRRRRGPDFAAAAQQLGVTEEQLKAALGVPAERPADGSRPPRPDFAAAAQQLGVTEEQLKEALGGNRRRPRPDLAAVAQELGISEQQLRAALGVPTERPTDGSRPPRPDLAAAAQQLGITEEQLRDVLRRNRPERPTERRNQPPTQ